MLAKTHMLFGLSSAFALKETIAMKGLPLMEYIHPVIPKMPTAPMYIALFYGCALLGSLLPDLDEPNSYISNKLPFFSIFLRMLGISHRGVTHFLFMPILIFSASYFLKDPLWALVVFSIGIGYLSHLLADSLTKGGIDRFFFPLPFPPHSRNETSGAFRRFALLPRVFRIHTGSIVEIFIYQIPLFLVCAYAALQEFGINVGLVDLKKLPWQTVKTFILQHWPF